MPLTYPIAETARDALTNVGADDGAHAARTVGEAREKAGGPVALVSEWLRPSQEERETLGRAADQGVGQGFVQIYEDENGRPVIAVTFWKRDAKRSGFPPPQVAVKPAPKAPAPEPEADTVDDLYFSPRAATKKSRKGMGRTPDPRQMDLFGRAKPDDSES